MDIAIEIGRKFMHPTKGGGRKPEGPVSTCGKLSNIAYSKGGCLLSRAGH
jgi:hypothetical protein